MKKSILSLDIGNTSTTWGIFVNGKLKKKGSFSTTYLTKKFPQSTLHRYIKGNKPPINYALICSVVPKASLPLKRYLMKQWLIKAYLLIDDIPIPIKNKAKHKKEVGQDRLVNALSAYRKLNKSCVVVDFGTAITFDVVSQKGAYLGGVIGPGIQITLNALAKETALLPNIELKHINSPIGKTTIECLRIGSSIGLGALCDGIISAIQKDLKLKTAVIATGGHAKFMSRYSQQIKVIDPDLTLKGIYEAGVRYFNEGRLNETN